MLIIVQFPLVDARRFLLGDTGRLRRPTWPTAKALPDSPRGVRRTSVAQGTEAKAAAVATVAAAKVDYDFIRGFGAVRHRKLGAINGTTGEGLYCDLRHLVKFRQPIPAIVYRDVNGSALKITGAHRRLYNDGRAMGRFELGFKLAWFRTERGSVNGDPVIPPDDVARIMRFVLESPVSVADHYSPRPDPTTNARATRHDVALVEVGPYLARAFLHSSTLDRHDATAVEEQSWWISVGAPVTFVSYAPGELDQLPASATALRPFGKLTTDISIAPSTGIAIPDDRPLIAVDRHAPSRSGNARIWYVGQSNTVPAAREAARRARVHLMRFASETEGAMTIIRLIQTGKIPLVRSIEDNDPSDRLQRYLGDAIAFLQRKVRKAMSNDALYGSLIASADIVGIDDVDSLKDCIRDARRSVRRRISEYVNYIQGDYVKGNKNELNVGAGGTASGIVQQNAGRDANAAVTSTITELSPEVKALFGDLKKKLDEATAAPNVSAGDKAMIQKQLEDFETQVKKGKENRKWYEVSAKGLLAATAAIGALVAPISDIVLKIVALAG